MNLAVARNLIFRVDIQIPNSCISDVHYWCLESFGWRRRNEDSSYIWDCTTINYNHDSDLTECSYFFSNIEDATLFKLRWL